MFDYITIWCTLPDLAGPTEFQTKSLECVFGRYEVDLAGRLFWGRPVLEEIPLEERSIDALGCVQQQRLAYRDPEPYDYTGDLEVHGWGTPRYLLRFQRGLMVQAVMTEPARPVDFEE
jgi:hypothetical protein